MCIVGEISYCPMNYYSPEKVERVYKVNQLIITFLKIGVKAHEVLSLTSIRYTGKNVI